MQTKQNSNWHRHLWWFLCGVLLFGSLLTTTVHAAKRQKPGLNFTQLQTQISQQKHLKGQWWTKLSDDDGVIVLRFNPKVVRHADRDLIIRKFKAMVATINIATKRSLLVIDHIEIQDDHQNVIAETSHERLHFYLL